MKKLLWILPIIAALGVVVWFRTLSTSARTSTAPRSASSESSAAISPSFQDRASTPQKPNRPAVPAPSEAAPSKAIPTATPTLPTAPVATLNELYRTFDAINAAAEANTPESLTSLVDYALTDNKDIRSAALDGLIRRDDPAAAKLLRAAAKKSDTSATIIALLQTADYLELPPKTMSAIAATRKPLEGTTIPHQPKSAVMPKPSQNAGTIAPVPTQAH